MKQIMMSVKLHVEVSKEHTAWLRLPDEVQPGPHELVVVLASAEAAPAADNSAALQGLSGSVEVFQKIDPMQVQNRLRAEWP